MTMQVDVAILGGGPAGSVVAGLLAAHGVSVVLIEKTDYGAPRVGESLPPAALPVLRRLELDRAVTDECYFRCPGIITVWGSAAPIEHDFIRMPYGYGLRLDRRRFDQSLANWAASAGAVVFTRTSPHTLRFQQRIWLLQLKGAFHQEVQARFIVDATGRNCFPICGAVKHQYLDRLVALVSVSRKTSLLDQRILIEAGPAGWWYSALLPTGQMMVSFFTDWDLLHYGRDDLWQYLADAPFTAERLRSSELDTPSVYHAPSKLRTNMQGDTWISVGDSASTFDPVSGQGVYKALSQAECAVSAIMAALDGDALWLTQYEEDVRSAFGKYLQQRLDYYQAELRWPHSPFWQRRTSPLVQ